MYCNIIFSDFKVFLVLPAANMCVCVVGGRLSDIGLYTLRGGMCYIVVMYVV